MASDKQVPGNGTSRPENEAGASEFQSASSVPQTTSTQQELPILNGTTATETAVSASEPQAITAQEIALYDRQIRLWGVQAQERIRTAHVLLIGLAGLGNEVAKNLALTGIGSLTIVDDQILKEEDLGSQFLVTKEHLGQNRAEAARSWLQGLNPRVKLHVNTSSVVQLAMDPTFFNQFTIVLAADLPVDILQTINAACRLCNKPFYAAATYGLYGYVFADLIQHTFIIQREKSNMATRIGPETATRSVVAATTKKSDTGKNIELVTKTELYSPLSVVINALLPTERINTRRRKLQITPILSCIKGLWNYQMNTAKPYPSENSHPDIAAFTQLATEWHKTYLQLPPETLKAETLRQFLQGVSTELPPVCAFLGGALAQNVVHVIGQNEQPIQNLLIFDGDEMSGEIYAMHPLTEAIIPSMMGSQAVAAVAGVTEGGQVNGNGINAGGAQLTS